jgi:hypothetical protein
LVLGIHGNIMSASEEFRENTGSGPRPEDLPDQGSSLELTERGSAGYQGTQTSELPADKTAQEESALAKKREALGSGSDWKDR